MTLCLLLQVVLYSILREMGHDGFLQHCEKVANFYKGKSEACLAAANKHLSGIVFIVLHHLIASSQNIFFCTGVS